VRFAQNLWLVTLEYYMPTLNVEPCLWMTTRPIARMPEKTPFYR